MRKDNRYTPERDDNVSTIPTIEILDLEADENEYEEYEGENQEQDKPARGKLSRFLNLHTFLLLVVVCTVSFVAYRLCTWGEFIDPEEIAKIEGNERRENFDQFLPLMTSTGEVVETGAPETILVFGNSPFSDDRGTEGNLANLIAKKTGATVYNCSVSGSYLAAQNPHFDAEVAPMDAYTFYWLVTLADSGVTNQYYKSAVEALGEDAPPEAQEVFDTLMNLDLNTVDVIALMYDATDYFLGHQMYSDDNATDIEQFTGNMAAGIELIQERYPHIRIIVMSPTYAFAMTEEGEYVSSDMYTYGQDVLSTYVIMQFSATASHSVTFVDNLYNSVTEDNASEYLTDNIHLNQAGRNLLADRFMEALEYPYR